MVSMFVSLVRMCYTTLTCDKKKTGIDLGIKASLLFPMEHVFLQAGIAIPNALKTANDSERRNRVQSHTQSGNAAVKVHQKVCQRQIFITRRLLLFYLVGATVY